MREVLAAAEDCEIGTAMRSADSWAALVALMNMPDKKQDDCLKKLKALNTATFSELIIRPPRGIRRTTKGHDPRDQSAVRYAGP